MGGIGRGRHWYIGSNDTTRDHRSIDIRRWKRDGLLSPGQSFVWRWSIRGEVTGSISILTEPLARLLASLAYGGRHNG